MNKDEIIKKVNEIKNISIADQKKDVFNNADHDGKAHKALLQYNALLDNVTFGAHSNKTFHYLGVDWTIRLLTGEEQNDIKKDVIATAKKDDCFEDFNLNYLTVVKFVTRALSPSPFKTEESKTIWSEADVKGICYGIAEEIYKEYIDFDLISTRKAEEFTQAEIEEMIEFIRKKPDLLRDLERPKYYAVIKYLMNYSKHLESLLKPDTNN